MSSQSRKAAKRYCGTIAHAAEIQACFGPMAGAVYTVLARHCDWVTGVAYLTVLQIASMIGPEGKSERHVQRWLAALVDAGVVGREAQIDRSGQRANRWTLYLPAIYAQMREIARVQREAALRKLQAQRAAARERRQTLATQGGDIDAVGKAPTGLSLVCNEGAKWRIPPIGGKRPAWKGGSGTYRQLMLAGLSQKEGL